MSERHRNQVLAWRQIIASLTVLWTIILLAACPARAFAQVTGPPYTFVAGTVISPDEINLSFSTIYSGALNRAGGTMTGNLLFSTDNTLDIGASGATRPRDLFLGRNAVVGGTLGVTGAATLSSTLAVTGNTTIGGTLGVTGATTLSAALTGTAATFSGTVTGNLFSGSGASLTSIPETAITDGALLARVGGNETISGTWTFSSSLTTANIAATGVITASAAGGTINIRPSGGSDGYLTFTENGVADRWALGIDDADGTLRLRQTNPTGTTTTSWSASGNLTHAFGVILNSKISPTTLSADANNYSPTGLSTTRTIRLITNNTTTRNITGIAAQSDGFELRICNIGVSGVNGSIDLTAEDGNSSAANRFATTTSLAQGVCATLSYDGTSSRWRPDS